MSFPSSLIRRMMISSPGVSVSCFYGCELTGSMEAIVDHERSCKLGNVECRFQLCMKKVRLEMLESHMKECSYRPILCPHCKHLIQTSEWITAHPGCFSDNIVRINIDNVFFTIIFKYVLLGIGSYQAFAVISTTMPGEDEYDDVLMGEVGEVRVDVYGLGHLEIEQFRAEITIASQDTMGYTVKYTKPLLPWEEFLSRRFGIGEENARVLLSDTNEDMEIKVQVALTYIN